MRRLPLGLLMPLAVAAIATPPAHANSVASVAVSPRSEVYFSDYVRNRIWRLDTSGRLTVVLTGRHTHHLVLGPDSSLFGEHVPMDPADPLRASLWKLMPGGGLIEIVRNEKGTKGTPYEGTVFAIDAEGQIYFLHECQLVRLELDGSLAPLAGRSCGNAWWVDDALRYGHLHGSLAWAPDASLYFSDARTVRRIALDGSVRTVDGAEAELFAPARPEEMVFRRVLGLAVDVRGTVYVADDSNRLLKLAPNGQVTLLANSSWFWKPAGLGAAGNDIYLLEERRLSPRLVADLFGSPRLRRITVDGEQTLTTVGWAGGELGFALLGALLAASAVMFLLHRRLRWRRT